MRMDTEKAAVLLEALECTCVVCRGKETYTARERGVKPLLNWLDNGPALADFCAADKVVGRATAFLYCLLGVKEVYARVMSRPAAQVLREHGIGVEARELVEGIINRKGTGPCPFEAAVLDIQEPQEALAAIRAKLREL